MEAPKAKETPELFGARVQYSETARNSFFITIPAETPIDAVLQPAYWKHVSKKFSPYTRIEVVTDDGEYFAELLVLNAGDNWAVVKKLSYHDLNNVADIKEAEKHNGLELKYRGPHYKWCVMRKNPENNQMDVIKEGFDRKEEAARELAQYARTISR